MSRLLSAAQMREIERSAMESGTLSGRDLMERAGRGALEATFRHWPDLARGLHRAVILCGPGNNGGDGFVMARLLAARGWEIDLRLMGDPDALPPDARHNHDRWSAMGATGALRDADFADASDAVAVLWIDAIFGTGLSRPFDWTHLPRFLSAIARSHAAGGAARVVALDMPSGWCADSGAHLRHGDPALAIRANLTLSFHAGKLGQYLGGGPGACGRVRVVDIGLDDTETGVPIVAPDPKAIAKTTGHKYDHGHALVLSGGVGQGGAARMAARAALRVGAGLVTLACPPAALIENAAQLNAIMLRAVKDGGALSDALRDARLGALALGPGLGTTDRARALVRAALEGDRPTVLDADAITLIAFDDDLRARLHGACVLTPHRGEFARLFPDPDGRLKALPTQGPAYGPLDAARDAADAIGAVVLLKGPCTVIAGPGGRGAVHDGVHDRAAPWLATAGAGDVLTGLIAGLLARGLSPFDAACTGAWLHVEAARAFGPGLIAEDLPDMIPRVLARMGA